MCEQVAKLVALDAKSSNIRVDQYLPPTENSYGRYPDVCFTWEGRDFVVELQMSRTFQAEISERCLHYEREGIPILWVLYGVDPFASDLPQSFRDVIRRHRGKVFTLDHEAVQASLEARTLVLKCQFSAEGAEGLTAQLVRFDELQVPENKLPYFKDCLVQPMLSEYQSRRRPWIQALRGWDRYRPDGPQFEAAFASLPNTVSDRSAFSRLLAVVLSLVSFANDHWENLATNHDNPKAMLNERLNNKIVSRDAELLSRIIDKANLGAIRMNPTVQKHITRAWSEPQRPIGFADYQGLRYLIPELLDDKVKGELKYFLELPRWAKSNG